MTQFIQLLRDQKFLHATTVLIGTMVGVGIYGIPFAFAKAGFFIGAAWLVIIAVVMALFYLMFAELVYATPGSHQLVGYASVWLGPWGRRVMALANVLSLYGALLAFMIVAGGFLHNILSNFLAIDPQWYSIVFALAWSLLWLARVRTVAAVELILVGIYMLVIVGITIVGLGHITWSNLAGWTPDFWYLPYGILLFSFAGLSAIPIQRQLLAGREHLMRPAIMLAIGVVSVLYLVFAFTIVGISGDVTSPEAFAGLYGSLGSSVLVVGFLVGVLTISTSYVMLGTALYETFRIDYRLRALTSWLLAVAPPIVFFLIGLRNFIDVIGLIGSVAVGLIAIVLLLAYRRACRAWPWAVWALITFFLAGMIYELFMR